MSWPEGVLGANLLVKPEEGAAAGVPKPTKEVLSGKKYVGLYFSAHWCGECTAIASWPAPLPVVLIMLALLDI